MKRSMSTSSLSLVVSLGAAAPVYAQESPPAEEPEASEAPATGATEGAHDAKASSAADTPAALPTAADAAPLSRDATPPSMGAKTPKRMRPLATDRPDTTESPYTVDRLHFQAEFDVARVTLDAGTESYGFMSSNLKVGITDFWEVQLVIDGLVGLPSATGHEWGSGDLDLRTKFNLVGNDSGPIAVGLMPWLTFPKVGSTDQIEGGLIGLLGWKLPADFSTGFMAQADAVKNELDSDYHFELLHTWTVGHPLVGPLGAYVEAFGVYSSEVGAEYALSMDGGLTLLVTDYVQLDAGVAGGLTEPADDLSVFSGLSFKL